MSEKGRAFLDNVYRVHLEMNTARPHGGDKVFLRRPNKEEASDMGVGFHGTSEGLLGNMGEGIYIVDDHPAIDTLLCCHLADEQTDLTTNGLDASVLFRAKKETFVRTLNTPSVGVGALSSYGVVLKKSPHQEGFSASRGACEKEVTGRVLLLETRCPYSILTH